MYPQLSQENVISDQNSGGLEVLGSARLAGAPGRCCSAMDSALVCWPTWSAMPGHAAPWYYEVGANARSRWLATGRIAEGQRALE
jgi:hypothetical protein